MRATKSTQICFAALVIFSFGRTSSSPTKNQCRRQAGVLLFGFASWICEDLCGIKRSSEICSLKFELGSAAGLREKIAYGKCSFPGNIGIERESRIWAGLSKKIAYGCLVGEFGSIPPASSGLNFRKIKIYYYFTLY